ncbi:MAG: hypothetical protein H7319_21575 [Spirosoma sp.]|nr:hypothetical protein [Spirosoma sp.]
MKIIKFFSIVAIIIATMSTSTIVKAQTPAAPYGEVTFVQVYPGMNDSYLAANKIVKKVNNNLKTAKAISTWQLYKRVYPVHGSSDFNFATFVVYASGKEMQALRDPSNYDAAAKELTTKEHQASLGTLPSIRTVVDRDLYTFRMGAGTAGSAKAGDYVVLTRVKATAGNIDAYEKMLETVKPAIEEAIKAGKLKSWNVWKRTLATNIDGASDFTVGFSFSNMDDALAYASDKVNIAAEFKKVYPKDDYTTFRAKQVTLREVVAQELWELVDITD